ncbi:iron-containing alcohol dehydrogenase family protein [Salipaludibacillus sp. CUR1]|uniref:iron-containing alcohol dehydrogenase family protein n=1 Tax=Salipaludibacillus sp. CUR1 TaxID=2820003 RepID=UPI001E64AB7D|nr:iron-containing alcohol dehydrogenase family protein [Salipaludibacillus sp. CUR1]MCE7791934.1 iron-containing alcohol dehydrogenase family protein [Salipaludibacillus sp. CUR1]
MAKQGMSIPIPDILEIDHGVLVNLETILVKHGFRKVAILFDEYSSKHYERSIIGSLTDIHADAFTFDLSSDIHNLITRAFEMERYDAVLAMGGGSIIDFGKYIAFSRRSPFISIPLSPSNDGFASSNCSLEVNGKKTTVPAQVPFGIIADLTVIESAPEPFILAGTGDLMSNITALYDWGFEEAHGYSQVNAFSAMLSKKAVNSFIRTPMTDLKQPVFLKELVSSLTMGGVSTVISGNSAPISGAEHMISHALDKTSRDPQMHGLQVGVCTYLMALVHDHRVERMVKVFSRTGFFDYVKQLPFSRKEFRKAIEMAPSIKPKRYTYLHEKKYRDKACDLLETDQLLKEIIKNP